MGVFDKFFGGSGQQQTQQQQQPNGQPPAQGQPNQQQSQGSQGAQGNNPVAHSNVNNPDPIPDPSALYAKMWENKTDQSEAPRLRLEGNVLDEVSGKMDFMRDAPQELVQKATSGDVQSLMQLMGWVSQRTYRASIEHSSALTDSFVSQRDAYNAKGTGSAVRSELLMQNLAVGKDGKPLPDYAKKQIADIAKRMQASYPDATPQEIAQSVREYVQGIAGMVSGDPQESNQKQQPSADQGAFDWDKWANTGSGS